jgi:hypothetical protein
MLAISMSLSASHFAGSDLTYTCLGGTSYEFSLSFYRDCSGISAPTTIPLVFECGTNPAFNFTATMQKVPGTGIEITPGCINVPTTCNGGTGYGLEEYVYKVTVAVPPCSNWKVSYSSCCRNPITTVNGSAGWYISTELNNLNAPCNTSPWFANKPVAVMCSGQNFCFNHGAIDPDGDSLSYSFVAPATTLSAGVNYQPPYSATNFLNSSTPITIDPVTGDICMTPTTNLTTVASVKIDEWRTINGQVYKVGTVFRDMQMVVNTCYNSIPTLSGANLQLSNQYSALDTNYSVSTCMGTPISFTINGFDADTLNPINVGHPENFEITWNNGIPGGTFQTFYNNTDSAYAKFSWTPNNVNPSQLHCFTATITDKACPYAGSQTFSYCVNLNGLSIDMGGDKSICEGEDLTITATTTGMVTSHIWKLDGTIYGLSNVGPTITIPSSDLTVGTHQFSVSASSGGAMSNCPGNDTISITVLPAPDLDLGNDTTVMVNATFPFAAPPGFASYLWSTGDTLSLIVLTSYPGVWKEDLWLTVTGQNGCTSSDSITIFFGNVNIDDVDKEGISVSPIPFDDFIVISQERLKCARFQLYSMDGKLVQEIEVQSIQEKVDLSHLPVGSYILKSNEEGGLERKIIKM